MKISKHVKWSIKHCPWKDDIHIDRSSFVGTGTFDSVKGREYHTVYCAADGPNPDGTTMHHGQIGYWNKFSSIGKANKFALKLWKRIMLITGFSAPVYASREDGNEHARWCMNETDVRPVGIHPAELPTELSGYQ